jgi:ABC-type nitrate/sulfonate/bicarbonate transport system permease component
MRVVQMKLPFPHLVVAALLSPENVSQLWLAGLITLRSALLGFVVGGLLGFGLAIVMAQSRMLEKRRRVVRPQRVRVPGPDGQTGLRP